MNDQNGDLKPLDYRELGAAIREVYTADKYQLYKKVVPFEVDGQYIGDFFNLIMLEPCAGQAPIFYHVYSPYDVISNKYSEHAVVLQSAEILFSAEVTAYVHQRTGIMTPLILQTLGVKELADKNVLFVGTGNIACCALAALKDYFADLQQVHFTNGGSVAEEFVSLAKRLQVASERADLADIGIYDVIICHSRARQPVLTKEMVGQIKPGALIAAYASEDNIDVAAEFYDTSRASVIIDWDQTIDEAAELKSAVSQGLVKPEAAARLKDLFAGAALDTQGKDYTIYRSHGTPMQDLAFLRLLLDRTS